MCGNLCRVFGEAWHRVRGLKKPLWAGITLSILIGTGGYVLLSILFLSGQAVSYPHLISLLQENPMYFFEGHAIPIGLLALLLLHHLGQGLFEMFVLLPMRMGLFLISLRHINNKPTHGLDVFRLISWQYIWRFAVLAAWIVLLIVVPIALAIIFFCAPQVLGMLGAGIIEKVIAYSLGVLLSLLSVYLTVAYLFSFLLIIDRKMSPWAALGMSRRVVTKHWFGVFGALIWMWIALAIGAMCFLVGLIWAVPYVQNIVIILYRELFGIEGSDPV